jgi:phenylacetate-coenzyme A ligase PaaK-like adenylate-forming protein
MSIQENYIENLLSQKPYILGVSEKNDLFRKAMFRAFSFHFENNSLFRNFCENNDFKGDKIPERLEDYPYLPVNIFKKKNLASVPQEQIQGVLNSSATSGVPSSISIDQITSKRQSIVSAKIMSDYLGSHRRPFFILDSDPLKAKSFEISARSAASRGFMIFANQMEYFLDEDNGGLKFNIDKFIESVEKNNTSNEGVLLFGFTFVLYQNVVLELRKKGKRFQLPEGSKIAHIGGWKKLESQKVSKELFLKDVSECFGVPEENIFDFYGFTEQMGLTYVSQGNLPKVMPVYSEIIIRDFQTLKPVEDGSEGLIQILTPIPHSYPGISVLTEDVGRIVGRGHDETGRFGTQFEILGRAKKAEARGCGDIMSEYVS